MTNSRIDLDRGIFPLAFSVVRCIWLPLGVAVLLLLGSSFGQGYLTAPLAFIVLRALIIMIIGHAAYRVLVTGGRVRGWRAIGTEDGRIPWRYAGIMLMILSPILFLGIIWSAPQSIDSELGLIPMMVIGVGMVVAYTVMYVLFGTALPEVAERGEVALGDAFERGRANYRAIATSLVFGAWLFRAGAAAALIGASYFGFSVDLFEFDTGVFEPAALVPMLLFKASHVFAEVLTAIVLVRAYRRFPVNIPDAVTA